MNAAAGVLAVLGLVTVAVTGVLGGARGASRASDDGLRPAPQPFARPPEASDDGLGPPPQPHARGPARQVGATLVPALVLALAVVALLRPHASSSAASVPLGDRLAFFEQRVRAHPRDVGARLDLAHRLLDAGLGDQALARYAEALELDPGNPEARAHVGLLQYLGGKPREALASVRAALVAEPSYPEALFFEGVILLKGLHRPADASAAFRAYLAAAPLGGERATARRLMREAEQRGRAR